MPNYENAAKGVKKVFLSQIFELVSSVLPTIGLIAILAGLVMEQSIGDTTEAAISVAGGAVMTLVGLAFAIVAFVFEIIGLNQAGKESESFRTAFILVVFQIIFTVAVSIFATVNLFGGSESVWTSILRTVSNIINIIVTIYIVNGCCELLASKGEIDLAIKGSNLIMAIVILYALGCFLSIIPAFVPNVLDMVMYALYVVVDLIAYIMFLSMLARTRRALLDNHNN